MLKRFRDYMYAAFSDNGSPSSSRLLMGLFSLFTVGIIWKIISHLLKVSEDGNDTTLTIWLSNLPLLITALCALIALPYTINRGTNAITDLAGMVSAFKNGKSVTVDKVQVQGDDTPPPATGGGGPKG